jgi:PTS system nitrogen regulatory IIA component
MKISDFLLPGSVCPDLHSSGKIDVLTEMAGIIAGSYSDINKDEIAALLIERERLASTGFGNGASIPHSRVESIKQVYGAFGISRTGIPFDATDGQPVHFFFVLLAPERQNVDDHIHALGRVSQLLRGPDFRQRVLSAKTGEEIFSIIIEEDGKV